MKIALVRQRYNPHGGAERFVERAMSALAARQMDLTLLTRAWPADADTQTGPRLVRCDPFYIGRVWRDWGFARSVCAALKSADFDLVQSHERIACCDIYRAGDGVHRQWLANRARAAGFWERVALRLNPYHLYTNSAEKRMFASPGLRAVICNSNMVREEVRRHFGLPDEKLHVIYNGVDLAAFHPQLRGQWRVRKRAQFKIPESAMVFLFVGSGFMRKGVPQLLRAMTGVTGAHLVLVGSDRELANMQAAAERLKLADRVRFVGGQDDVRPWYGMADCFVLPTLYDPFPNAALEAMACGLPLITTQQCGAAEFVESGIEGYICRDPLDVVDLARCLNLAASPAQSEKMGIAARKRVEPFGLDGMAQKLAELYQGLVASEASG
jgi:UDP-glucose:(heptosyl)LPS alpha-1,3-glucosyltransferase